MTHLAAYEPPYIVGESRPHPPADLSGRVRAMVANGRLGDAVERYLVEAAAFSPPAVAQIEASPGWSAMQTLAPTITHDLAIMGDSTIPADRLARIKSPTFVLDGAISPSWLRQAARTTAEAIPGARYVTLDGPGQRFDAATAAPVLTGLLQGVPG